MSAIQTDILIPLFVRRMKFLFKVKQIKRLGKQKSSLVARPLQPPPPLLVAGPLKEIIFCSFP